MASSEQSPEPIPEWAAKRACELANAEPHKPDSFGWTPDRIGPGGLAAAFARYIAQHEEAPVDPLVETVGDALACAGIFKTTDWSESARLFLSEMRRLGLEIRERGQ